MGLCLPGVANAWTDDQLAQAIYLAEGGKNTRHPYGVVSVRTGGDKEYARRICLNTIRNQKKRHSQHDCGLDYIGCLARRYCPVEAENDPTGLNGNWERNVRAILAKMKKEA